MHLLRNFSFLFLLNWNWRLWFFTHLSAMAEIERVSEKCYGGSGRNRQFHYPLSHSTFSLPLFFFPLAKVRRWEHYSTVTVHNLRRKLFCFTLILIFEDIVIQFFCLNFILGFCFFIPFVSSVLLWLVFFIFSYFFCHIFLLLHCWITFSHFWIHPQGCSFPFHFSVWFFVFFIPSHTGTFPLLLIN